MTDHRQPPAAVGVAAAAGEAACATLKPSVLNAAAEDVAEANAIPRRPFGRHDDKVSALAVSRRVPVHGPMVTPV